jgi:predicted GIY-YIG superfamily endonuclease
MTLCSTLSFNRRFGGTYRLHLQSRRSRFSKPASKQVATQRTTRRHIPEDDTLQNHRCENLKSYTTLYLFTCSLNSPNINNKETANKIRKQIKHVCTNKKQKRQLVFLDNNKNTSTIAPTSMVREKNIYTSSYIE